MKFFRKLFGSDASNDELDPVIDLVSEIKGKVTSDDRHVIDRVSEISAKVTGDDSWKLVPKIQDLVSARIYVGLLLERAKRGSPHFSENDMLWILGYIVGYSNVCVQAFGCDTGGGIEMNVVLHVINNLFPENGLQLFKQVDALMSSGRRRPLVFEDGTMAGYDDSIDSFKTSDIPKGRKRWSWPGDRFFTHFPS